MRRFLHLELVSAALALAASGSIAFGQALPAPAGETRSVDKKTSANVPVTPASSPVLAPKAENAPGATAPRRSRAVSSEVAAALAAAAPKYEPPAPKPEPKPESQLVDIRDIDKPKNEIIRLDPMIVQERKPAVFRERDIYTEKGLVDIAMRRYISDADRALNRWTLPLFGSSKEARAMAMYAEDERLQNMREVRDAAIDAARVDPAAGDYIRREGSKTFLRSADFGWSSGEPR